MFDVLSSWLSHLFADYVHWCAYAPVSQLKTALGIIVGGFILCVILSLKKSRRDTVRFSSTTDVSVAVDRFDQKTDRSY